MSALLSELVMAMAHRLASSAAILTFGFFSTIPQYPDARYITRNLLSHLLLCPARTIVQ